MRYVGGKHRIRKAIASSILSKTSNRLLYMEPFVGSCSVFQEMAPSFKHSFAGDMHQDLVMMWNGVLFDGWEPPCFVSEERYQELRKQPPSADRAFAGFGCSFGGKWFGGYARSGDRNYAMNMKRGLDKFKSKMNGVGVERFVCRDFFEWNPAEGSVVYLDPPYKNSQGYTTGQFDHNKFWAKASEMSKACDVFISEYDAPPEWECVLSVSKTVHLGGGNKHFAATEKLFKMESV
jgi:DNA adenine methylase